MSLARDATPAGGPAAPFQQPDRTTCGAAVLVRRRMLVEPDYDQWLRAAADPLVRFADEALRTHRRTNRVVDGSGRSQAPWPRALGTQPWALARELAGSWQVRAAVDGEAAWNRIAAAGAPAPLYVGSRLLPRHVVLVTAARDDALIVYDPASGRLVTVARVSFMAGSVRLSGWDTPWFTLTPR